MRLQVLFNATSEIPNSFANRMAGVDQTFRYNSSLEI